MLDGACVTKRTWRESSSVTSFAVMTEPGVNTTSLSTKFWSCRTLPGHRSRRSARLASSSSVTPGFP
jgi:hypothetical protein